MFWAKTSPDPVATTDLGEMSTPSEPAGTNVPSDDGTASAGGDAGTVGSGSAGAPVNQPKTSATSWVVRCAWSDTLPLVPRATTARFARVCHVRSALRLEVAGSAVWAG